MIKTTVVVALMGFASCARLDNLYLPPSSQNRGAVPQISSEYLPPNQGPAQNRGSSSGATAASNLYLPPSQFSAGSRNAANQIPILKLASENDGAGTYSYLYETANKITAEEQGNAREDGTKARGSFSYTAPDGQQISVSYTADENGFVPQGAHIPTPPPIPEAILKALEQNAAAEAKGIFDDGQYRGEGLEEGQYKGEGQGSGYSAGGSGAYAANGGYRY